MPYVKFFVLFCLGLAACTDDNTGNAKNVEARFLGVWKTDCYTSGVRYAANLVEFTRGEDQTYEIHRTFKYYDDMDCTQVSAVVPIGAAGPGPYSIGMEIVIAEQDNSLAYEIDYQFYSAFGMGSFVPRYDIVSMPDPDHLYFGDTPGTTVETRPMLLDLSRRYTRQPL